VLIGFTAWAVATVSVWWVPAYLLLMVLIFVVPQRRHAWTRVLEAGVRPIAADQADPGRRRQLERPDTLDERRDETVPASALAASDMGESPGSSPDFTASGTTKPRRVPIRTPKVVKTPAEPMPNSPPVTWKQVGPGKFIRIEGGIPVTPQRQVKENVAASASPPDTPGSEPLPAVSAAGAGDRSSDPFVVRSGDGQHVASDGCLIASVTEEHGIAPSAFSPEQPVASSGQGLPENGTEVLASLRIVPGFMTDLGRKRPRHRLAKERSWSDWWLFGSRLDLIRTAVAFNSRYQQAAKRAFERIAQVERALQPRSPPDPLGKPNPAGLCLRWSR
jgi:hypothetical protein